MRRISFKLATFILIAAIILTGVFAGCTLARRPTPPSPRQTQFGGNRIGQQLQVPGTQLPGTQIYGTQIPGTMAPGTQIPGTQNIAPSAMGTDRNDVARAKAISRRLKGMQNVKRAPVVVNGSTAIVGIETNVPAPDGRITRTNPARIATPAADMMSTVTNAVKIADPNIGRVLISTDKGIIDRIERLSNTLSVEMTDIMNRMGAAGKK